MDRTPIKLPPGVVRRGSEAEMEGHWYESHLVRWVQGVLRPVYGWERIRPLDPFTAFASPVRATHVWVTRDEIQRTAILCERHLYIMDQGGLITDITPTGGLAPVDYTIAGGYGDGIYYGAGGGLDPPNAPPDGATALDPIFTDPTGYGTARPDKQQMIPLGHVYTLDNFGDSLLAMTSADGRLLRWDPNVAAAIAEPVPNAPHGRFFVVTPERHVQLFQHEDIFNRVDWCSQEDIEDWDFTSTTNSAGFYEIEPASPFISGTPTRGGTLAFTPVGVYFFRYIGSPYFYSYEFLGHFNAPVANGALVELADTCAWYATDGFWMWDGQTIKPVKCDILDWIQTKIDPIWQFRRTYGTFIGVQSEVWWFFPEEGSTENTHYAAWNFEEEWWAMGRLSRTCGTPGSSLSYPIMSDGSNLFWHEKGLFYYDAPELPYAQSAAVQVVDGARQATMRKGLVDTRAPAGDVVFYIKALKDRISDGTSKPDLSGLLPVRRNGGKLDFRVTGRDIIIRIQSQRSGVEPWTFGKFMCEVYPRGRR
jgi:hypothetical protein